MEPNIIFGSRLLTFYVLFFLAISTQSLGQTLNAIKEPIIITNQFVHTKSIAKFPDELGKPARINSITSHGDYLYVTTFLKIYRLCPNGTDVQVFLDVQDAIDKATSGARSLSVDNLIHGGIRSIAFAPRSSAGRFYVSVMETRPDRPEDFTYISDVPNHIDSDSVLLEFRAYLGPRRMWRSYRVVFRVGLSVFDHTIRQIKFSPKDRYLYIAHGDGSTQKAESGGGQNNDALGKILRIEPRRSRRSGFSFLIPRSNPFVYDPEMPWAVYAIGFRNPHHICFDKSGDTLYVADTGRANVEEVNLVTRGGGNYGWSKREGTFVQVGGGLVTGIEPLPDDDALLGFTYPAAQVGHVGKKGDGFKGQAIGGACPVENGSPMSGKYFYFDFPQSGKLYFSDLDELKSAVTQGNPDDLTQASTNQVNICFDDDDDDDTPPKKFATLGDIVRSKDGLQKQKRADIRMGRGPDGELYWSSKQNGRLYVFKSSFPGGSFSSCE